ncbi:MAG: A24 family peptidase [Pirellulaceae bacterium]|nr:A24 family peptidase [Pirellulaceae bacterium]
MVDSLPFFFEQVIVYIVGLLVATQINHAIYRWNWKKVPISPWMSQGVNEPKGNWLDRLPIYGWLNLRHKEAVFGKNFWVRPLAIELIFPLALCWYYNFVASDSLLLEITEPHYVAAVQQFVEKEGYNWLPLFGGHLVLLTLLMIATFIDFDEKIIPDEVTVTGTCFGLLWLAIFPAAALPVLIAEEVAPQQVTFWLTSLPLFSERAVWFPWLNGLGGVVLGLASFLGWQAALLSPVATLRWGWKKGVAYFFTSLWRRHNWLQELILALFGTILIIGCWAVGGEHWQSLMTAIAGMIFGGAVVWLVRIIGGCALTEEAMGFGDVTLMAMIGVYVGWQGTLYVFFMAPFLALFVSLLSFLSTGKKRLAFGPYLCMATVILVLYWPQLWTGWGEPMFVLMGWFVPVVTAVGLLLMGVILWVWVWFKVHFLFPEK